MGISTIIHDLVHYSGFSYSDIVKMPIFERDFLHQKTIDRIEEDRKFEASLHGRKLKR